jgi:hypothetical protein
MTNVEPETELIVTTCSLVPSLISIFAFAAKPLASVTVMLVAVLEASADSWVAANAFDDAHVVATS